MEMTNNIYNIDVENQFDLLLEVLNNSAMEASSTVEGPLDLSVKKEDSFTPSHSPVSSFFSGVSSPVSVCSSNSNDSILDFDESFLPSPVSGGFNNFSGWFQPEQTAMPVQTVVTSTVKVGRKGVCTNCGTSNTSTWRKDGEGRPLCNACGLYFRIHKIHRPAEWARSGAIMRRQRKQTGRRHQRT